jgi:CRP-like cAMP-binding protein
MERLGAAIGHDRLPAPLVFVLLLAVAALCAWMKTRTRTRTARLEKIIRRVELLDGLGAPEIAMAIEALEVRRYSKGDVIYRQDDQGDDCFFVDSGECYASAQELMTLVEGTRIRHKKHGVGTVVKDKEANITKVDFDKGESHRYVKASLHKLKPLKPGPPKVVEVRQYHEGDHFGERALSRARRGLDVEPRPATITCRTDVTVLRLTAATFIALKNQQDHKENLLRNVTFFETFSDDQIALLASLLEKQEFGDQDALITQGEVGKHLYILDSGECRATIVSFGAAQEVKRYVPGDLFGELALLENQPRAASITAVGDGVTVWALSRDDFENKMGSLSQLKAEQYLTDPRHLIADFYCKGDAHGPAGTLGDNPVPESPAAQSSWFAVYRPCSRDSIAKMLDGAGTGKGLNIKGKSAKKNRLSGFVPFCQISNNDDRKLLEGSPREARVRVFFQSEAAAAEARRALESTLVELQVEKKAKLQIEDQQVLAVREYEPSAFGLDVPELLLMEVYIMRADVSPVVGWETGRDSEPAFLDMNRHSLRDGVAPPVVLYQFDTKDPLNPLGLLMAYAENRVTPVVSDFDTFLVGSKGVSYTERMDPKQVELMKWALKHTAALLEEPNAKGWMGRWLNVLKVEAANGFHPTLPKYGFGDPVSYGLIGQIVDAMSVCGAVRHGAECFNFYFPQELDDEFLVVWDGFSHPPWKSFKEPELRKFLIDRCADGYSFPLNPVWPVRDPGWLEVLHALRAQETGRANLRSWFPPESGVLEQIEALQRRFPKGFTVVDEEDAKPPTPVKAAGNGSDAEGGPPATPAKRTTRRASFFTNLQDCDGCDMASVASLEVKREANARWRRIRIAMKMHILSVTEPPTPRRTVLRTTAL